MEEKTRVKKKSARVFFSKNTCVFGVPRESPLQRRLQKAKK
ncbi:hypothetical protein M949_1898 [Riemerella anatipestifer CH3]|nr:hypothetical protein M949_1898 [Riemerella anatipestifer CH3]